MNRFFLSLFVLAGIATACAAPKPVHIFCEGRLLNSGGSPRSLETVTFAPRLVDVTGAPCAAFDPAEYSVTTDDAGYFSFYATLANCTLSADTTYGLELGNGLPRRTMAPVPLAACARHAAKISRDDAGRVEVGALTANDVTIADDVEIGGGMTLCADNADIAGVSGFHQVSLNNPNWSNTVVRLMSGSRPASANATVNLGWTREMALYGTYSPTGNDEVTETADFTAPTDGLCFVSCFRWKPYRPEYGVMRVSLNVTSSNGESFCYANDRIIPALSDANVSRDANLATTFTFPLRAGDRLDMKGFVGLSAGQSADGYVRMKFYPFGK